MTPEEALKKAIQICGTEAELGRRLGVTGQAVNQWQKAPPLRVLDIEKATEGKVTRYELRPDMYPSGEAAA